MARSETLIPRLIAALLLLGSVATLAPLGAAVIAMLRGQPVAAASWATPLIVLALGSILIWLLSRKQVATQLFVVALALWLAAVGFLIARAV
jgi:hypothetical protein